MRLFIVALMLALGLLAACEPEATPIPAFIDATPDGTIGLPLPGTLTVTPAQPQVRYGLMVDSLDQIPELDQLEAVGTVTRIDRVMMQGELSASYDIAAAYGDRPGWQLSPVRPGVSLIVNATIPPLDQPAALDAVRASLDAQAITGALNLPGALPLSASQPILADLRRGLANAGWPDGFDLRTAYMPIPGIDYVAASWRVLGILTEPHPLDDAAIEAGLREGQLNAAVITWANGEERARWEAVFGPDALIDLYAIPISYWSRDGLSLTFTPGGWPIPQ